MAHSLGRVIAIALLVSGLACSEEAVPAFPDAGLSESPAPPPTPPDPPPAPPEDEPADDDGNDGPLACSLDELTPILECVVSNCVLGFDLSNIDPTDFMNGGGLPLGGGFDTGAIMECAVAECLPTLLGLSPECVNCIFTGISGASTEELIAACAGDLGSGLGGSGGLPSIPGLPTP